MNRFDTHKTFEQYVRPHFDRLYRLAWRLCGQKAEAEDLFQELVIRAYSKLDEIVALEDPGSWLSRVMYNLFVDQHRRFSRQRMHVVTEDQLPADGINALAGDLDPVADNERIELNSQLENALHKLDEEQRIIVLLHDTEGYKLIDIQSLMGIPIGTVKSRLHRARGRLKELLLESGTF